MSYDVDARCPCLSGETYGECCGPFHAATNWAPTAERLMRSRYSAFVVLDSDYLLHSWAPATRPASIELDPTLRWIGLEIVGSTRGMLFDTQGTVEFIARYRSPDGAGSQHETSRFVREDRRWFYLDAL